MEPRGTIEAKSPDAGKDFVELYRAVAPAIYAWSHVHIGASLRRRLDPDDIVQEVCYRAFQKFAAYDPQRARFRTWIFAIAHNVLRESLRKKTARGESVFAKPSGDTAVGLDAVPDEATGVSTYLAQEEGFQDFLSRVSDLDEDEKRLLLYRGLEGLSHEDIATVLNVTIESAQKRWQRLRKKLRGARVPEGLFRE